MTAAAMPIASAQSSDDRLAARGVAEQHDGVAGLRRVAVEVDDELVHGDAARSRGR